MDSSGLTDKGSWYLMSVNVLDIQTGIRTKFIADTWLALDRGEYEDDITLHAIDEEDAPEAAYLFKSGMNRKVDGRSCLVVSLRQTRKIEVHQSAKSLRVHGRYHVNHVR